MAEWDGPVLEWRMMPTAAWSGGRVPPQSRARYVHDGLLYTLDIRVQDDRPRLVGFSIEPPEDGEIPRVAGVPTKDLMERALNKLRWAPPAGSATSIVPAAIARTGKRELTRGFLKQVAAVWKDARKNGLGGTKAVAESFAVSYRTSARWVAAARAKNLIPKGER